MRSIDLVHENPHLSFEQNVDYSFALWDHTHGDVDAVVDTLVDSDVIAIEIASFYEQGEKVSQVAAAERHLSTLNSILAGTAKPETVEQIEKMAAANPDEVTTIATRFAGSGKKLYFIDAWVHADEPDHPINTDFASFIPSHLALPNELLHTTYRFADNLVLRESLAMQQLADIGKLNAPIDQQAKLKVGVLYGAYHSLLPIAMHDLGANVNHTFITDKPLHMSADTMLLRTLRATDASPEQLRYMAQNVHLARLALQIYATMHAEAEFIIENSYSDLSAIQFDSQLTLALGKDSTTSESVCEAIGDYIYPPKKAGLNFIEERREKRRTDAFMEVMARFVMKPEVATTASPSK